MKNIIFIVAVVGFSFIQSSCQDRGYPILRSHVDLPSCSAEDHGRCDVLELRHIKPLPYAGSLSSNNRIDIPASRPIYNGEEANAQLIQGSLTQDIDVTVLYWTESSDAFSFTFLPSSSFSKSSNAMIRLKVVSFEGAAPKIFDIPVVLN